MTELDPIVVPLDGSAVAARVLPVVRALVDRAGAKVILVTSTLAGGGASPGQLDEAAERLSGIQVERVIVEDRSAADAAVDVALVDEGRLVCMSTHGRGGLRRAVLGSVADEVIRAGAVPVLLVGPSCDPGAIGHPGPIELCIDGSKRCEAVVDAGLWWATLLGRDAHFVTVANPFDPVTGPESQQTFATLGRPLSEAGIRVGGTCDYNSSVPMGLVLEAERLKSPLMVIAPAARSTWTRMLIGSTTLGTLSDAPCPVLVLPGPARAPRTVS